MTRPLLAMLCLITLTPLAFCQSIGTAEVRPAAPATMFSYLTIDMRVGIKRIEGTTGVLLFIYAEDDFVTAIATTNLGQVPLAIDAARSSPAIKRELDAYMTQNDLDDASSKRIRLLPQSRITFGRIDAIGDDYLLIGLENNKKIEPDSTSRRRRIIPKASIGSIDLDARPAQFITYPARDQRKPGG